jgi:hypothetical protein
MTRIIPYRLLLPLLLLGLPLVLPAQSTNNRPGNRPGTDYDVIVSPGPEPGALAFSFTGCEADCDQRPVKASSKNRRTTLSFKFRFPGENITMAQVTFPEGTPLFQERENSARRRAKFYDSHSGSARGAALGFAEIRRSIKTVNWRQPEGVSEMEDGDSFKYDVLVITQAGGVTKVYAADPIIIVRGVEDDN